MTESPPQQKVEKKQPDNIHVLEEENIRLKEQKKQLIYDIEELRKSLKD